MQTIKGFTVLALVAVVVFVVTAGNDMKSQARYAARMHSPGLEEMKGKAGVNAPGSVKSGVMAASKTDKQAPRKVPAT